MNFHRTKMYRWPYTPAKLSGNFLQKKKMFCHIFKQFCAYNRKKNCKLLLEIIRVAVKERLLGCQKIF